jgi:hypothetical protein
MPAAMLEFLRAELLECHRQLDLARAPREAHGEKLSLAQRIQALKERAPA